MEEKKDKKIKQELSEKEKEKQKTILLIGVFFMIAVVFAISGISNLVSGNSAAGLDRILGAAALSVLGIWYVVRDRRKDNRREK